MSEPTQPRRRRRVRHRYAAPTTAQLGGATERQLRARLAASGIGAVPLASLTHLHLLLLFQGVPDA